MKTLLERTFIGLLVMGTVFSCDKNDDAQDLTPIGQTTLTEDDREALLFMLEEEKLARDTYIYLGELWNNNQFLNIKQSEQSHMDAVTQLLDTYEIDYTILANGDFNNTDIQALYDVFITSGSQNVVEAMVVGATIEDLDIVDLGDYIKLTSNAALISVFENLQCGSRNHLRSFTNALEIMGSSYTPQYLDLDTYSEIISATNERCGW